MRDFSKIFEMESNFEESKISLLEIELFFFNIGSILLLFRIPLQRF